jgi:hypothetical protein
MSADPSLLSSPPVADPVAVPPPSGEARTTETAASAEALFEQRSTVTCAVCSASVDAFTASEVNGHPVCPGCLGNLKREVDAESARPRWAAAAGLGLLGAAIGAAVWAAIAIGAGIAIGYIAILVGFLAGFGVRIGAGTARSRELQILAVVLAVVGLVLAKYGILAGTLMGEYDVSPFDPEVRAFFFENFTSMLSPFDALWLFFAVGAAWKVPAPSMVDVG